MTNLRNAAAEIENAKKVTKSSWVDSTYRQKIEDTLAEVSPGLEGDRLAIAAKFFKPEWEVRSQKFIKRFSMWSKRAVMETALLSYVKFGNGQKLNVAALANNLNLTFPQVLFQVVQLSAFGLCRRVEPTVGHRGDPVFNVVFVPSNYMRFFLETREVADEFNDDDIHDLGSGIFAGEVERNPAAAVAIIKTAVEAMHQFEEAAKNPTEEISALCRNVLSIFEAAPKTPLTAPAVLTLLNRGAASPGLVTFCMIVLALQNKSFVRVPGPQFALSLGTPESKVTSIGGLSTQHAKEVLKAAAAQSPVHTDPVMPPSAGFKLDATMLGAATVEQLTKIEQSLRGRIEQIGKSLSDRVTQLESDVAAMCDGEFKNVKLQARIDVVQDQVAVLMKLVGLGPVPTMTVHTAPPTIPKTMVRRSVPPTRPRTVAKRSSTATKKPAKSTSKQTPKKAKKRR